ncbi:hypothetical protein [Paenibacillus sp.]|nr:hypothetical protein [Paenibacillus sp.]
MLLLIRAGDPACADFWIFKQFERLLGHWCGKLWDTIKSFIL